MNIVRISVNVIINLAIYQVTEVAFTLLKSQLIKFLMQDSAMQGKLEPSLISATDCAANLSVCVCVVIDQSHGEIQIGVSNIVPPRDTCLFGLYE